MASSSMKPLLLLAGRCRPTSTVAATCTSKWMAATTTSNFQQTRTLSDDRNNRDHSSNFRMRRPTGGASGRAVDRGSQAPGFRGGRNNQRGGPKKKGPERPPMTTPQPSFLRTHMIDLFPGNYKEIAGTETDDMDDGNDRDEYEYAEMEETMAKIHQETMEYEAKKKRWLENSIPQVRVPVIDHIGRSYGRGGRKRAQARVWITPGFGNVTVNRMDFIDYFPRRSDREILLDPMVVTRTCGKFDLQCQVKGGGLTGQAGAIRLGVARALQHWNPEYRPPMKLMGYLTRDARKVERKKIGRVKARKRPQWNRR